MRRTLIFPLTVSLLLTTTSRCPKAASTGHHYKDGLAFKFEDDLFQTKLQTIEWTPGRTGEIAPVAIFEPVEIDGCEVSRASLHNLSFIEDLELAPGCRLLVSKRNMIIPHVEENLDRGNFSMNAVIPHQCPCCGEPTRIHETSGRGENGEERVIKTLFCDNAACETRRLKQFVHFVSKKAMNIEGLSEGTLEKLIGRGWIHSYLDIYRLDQHRNEIIRMEGFGENVRQRLSDAHPAEPQHDIQAVCYRYGHPDSRQYRQQSPLPGISRQSGRIPGCRLWRL